MASVGADYGKVVLALNAGSSSLKFGLYRAWRNKANLICEGEAEEIGRSGSSFWFRPDAQSDKDSRCVAISDGPEALKLVLQILAERKAPMPEAIGHRIVHGGSKIRDHVVITPDVMKSLHGAESFAPLHVPVALHLVEACLKRDAQTPQIACLDTAFHRSMPEIARALPLPESVRELGVERYGFHGLSVQSVVDQLNPTPGRTIVAHLGGGCSVTALLDGKSVDTTMGFTPAGGIMMGTRTGDIDPGVLLFLMRNGFSLPDDLENLLDRKSGLLGVSETTSDMRELRKTAPGDSRAALALRLFLYSVQKSIAGSAVSLGGLDALVFTGGIGEHDGSLRDDVVSGLSFLGKFDVQALPSREEATMAKITALLCGEHR